MCGFDHFVLSSPHLNAEVDGPTPRRWWLIPSLSWPPTFDGNPTVQSLNQFADPVHIGTAVRVRSAPDLVTP